MRSTLAPGLNFRDHLLGYWDVDYQANVNLLHEALRSDVPRFAYVHVLNAERMNRVPLVAAKSAFVRELRDARIGATVIAPTGYFSDMADVLHMAQAGRVWLFGNGQTRINPIHGADLASALYGAVSRGKAWLDVGGPQTFTQTELAQLCFDLLDRPARITYLPDALRRAALRLMPYVAPRHIAGPAQFFLTASGMNMTAPPVGGRDLRSYLTSVVKADGEN